MDSVGEGEGGKKKKNGTEACIQWKVLAQNYAAEKHESLYTRVSFSFSNCRT